MKKSRYLLVLSPIIAFALGVFLFLSGDIFLFSPIVIFPQNYPIDKKGAIMIANSAISVHAPEKRLWLCREINEGGVPPERRNQYFEEYLKKHDYYDVIYMPISCCFNKCPSNYKGAYGVRVYKGDGYYKEPTPFRLL